MSSQTNTEKSTPNVEIAESSDVESKSSEFYKLVRFIAGLLVLVFFIRGSIISPYKIPSSSMVPTLLIGDQILVFKLLYGIRLPYVNKTILDYSFPKRGDIVVFTRPEDPTTPEEESNTDYIKRVIALPGETVEVRGRTVLINGNPLEDDSHAIWLHGGAKGSGQFPMQTVPEGHIFLLGDNRDASKDSRYWDVTGHFLDARLVKGRAFLIMWNFALPWDQILPRMFKVLE